MDVPEIAAAATAMSAQQTQQALAVKSVDMANDQLEMQGELMMQLLEVTVQGQLQSNPLTTLGANIDIKA